MPKNPTYSKEIEQYLAGELQPEHAAEFEKRINEEQELREELEATKKVISGIQGYAFKEMLKKFHQEYFPTDNE